MQALLSSPEVEQIIKQLASVLYSRYGNSKDVVYIAIQQGGVKIGDRIVLALKELNGGEAVQYGQLDITFYRDDIRKNTLAPDRMNIPFGIENKIVVLIDDVLFTGRTIKAALDVLLDYGRPAKVELCVLIDRKEHRQFPIQADYSGKEVNTRKEEKVKIRDGEVVVIGE